MADWLMSGLVGAGIIGCGFALVVLYYAARESITGRPSGINEAIAVLFAGLLLIAFVFGAIWDRQG